VAKDTLQAGIRSRAEAGGPWEMVGSIDLELLQLLDSTSFE
jgi:hypothetical protein